MVSVAYLWRRRDTLRIGLRCGNGPGVRVRGNFASGAARGMLHYLKMGMEFPETAVKADDSCCAFCADSGVATLKRPATISHTIRPVSLAKPRRMAFARVFAWSQSIIQQDSV